jgi:hypothetical protein
MTSNFINLNEEEEDSLCWVRKKKLGSYTMNMCYLLLAKKEFESAKKWWWPCV